MFQSLPRLVLSRFGFRFSCFLIAALLVTDAACAYDFKSSEGGVRATFKAEPTFKKITGTYLYDKSEFTLYQWLQDGGDKAWIVQYINYVPGTVANTGGEDKFYERAIQGGLAAAKGTPIGQAKPVVNSGLTGRDFLQSASSLEVRQQIFVKGDRLYAIIYGGPPGTTNSAEVQAFFSSLRIDP
jgi:hypothetical protein